jgi:hypothetical protein
MGHVEIRMTIGAGTQERELTRTPTAASGDRPSPPTPFFPMRRKGFGALRAKATVDVSLAVDRDTCNHQPPCSPQVSIS